MTKLISISGITLAIIALLFLTGSCKKLREFEQKPDIEPLQHGLKTSMAIAYCVSVANSAYKGRALPDNVIYDQNTGLIYIHTDATHPLPFNNNVGDIVIAGIWRNSGGIISILFSDIDILGGTVKLYGLHTVPVIEDETDHKLLTVFAKQDVIIGYDSDTILHLGNITDLAFNTELDRVNSSRPTDAFVAVKQNVWFIDIDQKGTYADVYDDNITLNGGGQIAEVLSESGGVVYHAVIDAVINYSVCNKNPVSGNALSQNFKAGGSLMVDLGNSFLSFHNNCDGMVHVDFSSGKYITYNGKNISLNLY